jgi:hypothetical protein
VVVQRRFIDLRGYYVVAMCGLFLLWDCYVVVFVLFVTVEGSLCGCYVLFVGVLGGCYHVVVVFCLLGPTGS